MPHRRHSNRDDPAEILDLAASSLRLIGGILLLVSIISVTVILIGARAADFDRLAKLTMYVVPAVLLIIIAPLVRRHAWAAVIALLLTGTTALVSGLVTVSLAVLLITGEWDALWTTVVLIPTLVFTLAVAVVTYHLTRTFDAIRRVATLGRQNAFEPIMASGPNRHCDAETAAK